MKRPDRGSIEALVASVARDLGPVLDECVFVGGIATGLLITDPAATRFPVTTDLDLVVEIKTRGEYEQLSERLRALGLRHDTSTGAPICRWITPTDGLLVDVMPSDEGVLGFSNPWYDDVLRTAEVYELASGPRIRLVWPPAHLASKWAAYGDRGIEDPLQSRDLEDIVILVAGRPELSEEVANARPELREWVAQETRRFLDSERAAYVLTGSLPEAGAIPGLVQTVRDRFERIAFLGP